MNEHIKLFETHADYEEYINSQDKILPNVSLCEDQNELHYNPYIDPYNGHEYVEIGGLKWATMNVGANSETDYGLYFQWGDIQGYTAEQVGSGENQKYFGWPDYKFDPDGWGLSFTKYNQTDQKNVLDPEDDAAHVNWGGEWRMPTKEELQALGEAVNVEFVTNYKNSGVNGMICTDKTDNSKVLFFPLAGHAYLGTVNSVNSSGNIWSSNGMQNDADKLSFYLVEGETDVCWGNCSMERLIGYSVRGVIG